MVNSSKLIKIIYQVYISKMFYKNYMKNKNRRNEYIKSIKIFQIHTRDGMNLRCAEKIIEKAKYEKVKNRIS